MSTRDARPSSGGRLLLERISASAPLAQVVPRLLPEVLYRLIEHRGLEDSGELLALATPAQLTHVLDRDLWRPDAPGHEERFDADRFGTWLDVLADMDAADAARTLAAMDVDLAVAGFAAHVRVFDPAAVGAFETTDGDEWNPGAFLEGMLSCEIGGYRVAARRLDAWGAIVDTLVALAGERPDAFARVMQGCQALSSSRPEADGFHDLLDTREQHRFDVSCERERRREAQGFVSPAQARAFLHAARDLRFDTSGPPPVDPIARAHVGVADAPAAAEAHDALVKAGLLPQAPQLGFLANAIAAGCSIDARPFTAQEARDAAVAACSLGLANWPRRWPAAGDLVHVFQVGWSVLHTEVGLHAAAQLLAVLADLRVHDSETGAGLLALRVELSKQARAGTPWRAREAMDVLATLDVPAWMALLRLIDECPTIHAAIDGVAAGRTRIDPHAFAFVAGNGQIATVRAYLERLPDLLGP